MRVTQFFNGSDVIREQYSEDARCYTFTRESGDEAVCLSRECTPEGILFQPDASRRPVLCPYGEVRSATTPGLHAESLNPSTPHDPWPRPALLAVASAKALLHAEHYISFVACSSGQQI